MLRASVDVERFDALNTFDVNLISERTANRTNELWPNENNSQFITEIDYSMVPCDIGFQHTHTYARASDHGQHGTQCTIFVSANVERDARVRFLSPRIYKIGYAENTLLLSSVATLTVVVVVVCGLRFLVLAILAPHIRVRVSECSISVQICGM